MTALYRRSNTFIFITLFLFAFAIRLFFLLYFKFDGLYGQDAYAYEENSRLFYQSVINFEVPQYFYWPIGFYVFSAIFSLITAGKTALSSLLVSLNAGALTAGVMFLLCFEFLKNHYTAERAKKYSVIAGLIVCLAGITIKQSAVIMSDALGLLFITVSAYYLVKYFNEQNRKFIIICLVAYALAVITRYANGLFIIPVIIVLFVIIKKSPQKKRIVFDIFSGTVIGFIIFLPQLLYIVKYGIPYFQYKGETPTWASSWNPLNIFRSGFFTVDGTQQYKLINGLFYFSPSFHPMFLSLFGFPFLFGLYKGVKKIKGTVFIFILTWIAVYVLYLSGNPFQSIRYTLSFFPALIVLSVYGLADINTKQFYKYFYVLTGLILLSAYSFYDFSKFAERKNKEMECIAWIQNNIPAGSNLFTFEVTGAAKYYTGVDAKEFHSYSYYDIKKLIDTTREKTYLLLPVDRINSQWKDLPIAGSFDSLKKYLNPTLLGKVNDYEGFIISK